MLELTSQESATLCLIVGFIEFLKKHPEELPKLYDKLGRRASLVADCLFQPKGVYPKEIRDCANLLISWRDGCRKFLQLRQAKRKSYIDFG
jgi:hypothetical protein